MKHCYFDSRRRNGWTTGLFNDDRFESFKRLGPDKVPDLESLVAFADEFTSDPRWYRSYTQDGDESGLAADP